MEGDDVHVKMEGKLVNLLAQIYPKICRQYMTDENGKLVLYIKLKRAIYGTLQVVLLF